MRQLNGPFVHGQQVGPCVPLTRKTTEPMYRLKGFCSDSIHESSPSLYKIDVLISVFNPAKFRFFSEGQA